MAGFDPLSFANAKDEVELQYLISVAEKAIEAYEIAQKNSARLIVKYLHESLSKPGGVQGTN